MLHCSSAPELCRDRNSGLPPLANSSRVRVQSLKCRKILTKKCQNRRATFIFRLHSLFLIEFMAAQFQKAGQGNPGHPCWSVRYMSPPRCDTREVCCNANWWEMSTQLCFCRLGIQHHKCESSITQGGAVHEVLQRHLQGHKSLFQHATQIWLFNISFSIISTLS